MADNDDSDDQLIGKIGRYGTGNIVCEQIPIVQLIPQNKVPQESVNSKHLYIGDRY